MRPTLCGKSEQVASKGSRIHLEGSIRSRKYEDKEGKERTVFEIHAYEMSLLDASRHNGSPAPATAGVREEDDIPF